MLCAVKDFELVCSFSWRSESWAILSDVDVRFHVLSMLHHFFLQGDQAGWRYRRRDNCARTGCLHEDAVQLAMRLF